MDSNVWPGASRRRFLAQVTAAGAAAGSGASLPAAAQDAPAASASPGAGRPANPSIAETLARYAATLKYEDLPPEVVATAKRSIIDTFACALGGYSAEPAQIAVKLAAQVSARPGATVLCSGARTSPEMAVFANGVMVRYLDFNDGYISMGSGHPSDTIASLLASAELAGSSGRDLIVATVAAYEAYCKVTDVMDNQALGLDNATVAGLGAAVGASRLAGLSQAQMVHAISLAAAGNTAVSQTRRGVLSSWKACSSAEACRNAMFAVQLAQAGMTGPGQVFEGREGFFNLVKLRPFALPALGGAGEPFGIMRAYTKRFALGQYAQTAAQAAMQARESISDPSQIEEVVLRVSHNAIRIMADVPDKWRPQTHETADHSLPYSVAVILKYGEIDAHYYEDKYLHDARLLELVSRVRVLPSEEADRRQQEINLCDLEIALKSGERKSIRVEYHRGHWKNPMTDAEMDQKFRGLAHTQLRPKQADALLRQLWAVERMPRAGVLAGMTRIA